MTVSAIIVTRGGVDMKPIMASLPLEWEVLVWNNALTTALRWSPDGSFAMFPFAADLSVYGRYAAIEYASHDIIYVQDDDVIVSDPQAIVDAWMECGADWPDEAEEIRRGLLVANMPQEFRHDFYIDHALVGFGAAFHRDAPTRAFKRFNDFDLRPLGMTDTADEFLAWYRRTCDVVFTALTPRVLVDVPKVNLPYASDDNRMWKQPSHQGERQRMLDLVRKLK